jgi:hypothetical protein
VELPPEVEKIRNYTQVGYYVLPNTIYCLLVDKAYPVLMYIVDDEGDLFAHQGRLLLKKPLDVNYDIVETYAYAATRAKECIEEEFIIRDVNKVENIEMEVLRRW